MPRIYDSTSCPHDFCGDCMPNGEDAFNRFGRGPDGPDNRGNCYGYDADHPDYDECDYYCQDCQGQLYSEDN